jgi:hypothetical protein
MIWSRFTLAGYAAVLSTVAITLSIGSLIYTKRSYDLMKLRSKPWTEQDIEYTLNGPADPIYPKLDEGFDLTCKAPVVQQSCSR